MDTKIYKGAWWWFALIFGLGAVLRFFNLGRQGLFFDEAWSWAVAELPLVEIIKFSFYDPHPILYYALLKGSLFIFPETQAGLRILSVLCSIASLIIIMFFANRWFGVQAAIFAGFFMALSTFDLYYAQDVRMYTLLGLLWLLSYTFLVEIFRGSTNFFIGWIIINTFMAWTHLYGLLVAYINLACLFGGFIWYRIRKIPVRFSSRLTGWGMAIFILCTLQPLYLIWLYRSREAGGAWVPKVEDIFALFALVSTGLTSARSYFLDSTHLTFPIISQLPLWVWVMIGLLFGGYAIRALIRDWEEGVENYPRVLFALIFLLTPVIIFGYTLLTQRSQWAMKPFLGVAYIFYLWAGLGVSQMSQPIRSVVATLAIGTSLLSLLPYNTIWHKTDAPLALTAIMSMTGHKTVLLDQSYIAPLAHYYLKPDSTVLGINKSKKELYKISPNGILPEDFNLTSCDDPELSAVEKLWVYGSPELIRRDWQEYPACLANKSLYIFENNEWVILKP